MQTDYDYYLECKRKVEGVEKDWKAKKLSNEYALQVSNDWKKALMVYIANDGPTPTRAKIEELLVKLNTLMGKIKQEMKNVYIIQTDSNQTIVCADENLVKKCTERFGKNATVTKTTICVSEQDLDKILPQKEEPSLNGDFVYLEFNGLP